MWAGPYEGRHTTTEAEDVIEILRNLKRRKLRSALTISGIVIGIFALTTMGAMAEHFNALLSGGIAYAGSSIAVGPPDGVQPGLLPISMADQLRAVDGVAAVYPRYMIPADPGGTPSFGAPPMIVYQDPGANARSGLETHVASGRDLSAASGEVVLGSSLAIQLKKSLNATVDLPLRPKDAPATFVSHSFKVVGILQPTGTAPDSFAYVSLADARTLLSETFPPQIRGQLDLSQLTEGFTVFGAPGASVSQLDAIAGRINATVTGVKATKPSDSIAAFKSFDTTFSAVTIGSALLALVIGGLSVVNTMIMAVSERTREIGLKKALGARTSHVLREYLLEAAVIGFLGGATGYLLGLGLTTMLNAAGKASGLDMFLITPPLTALCIGFAVAIATLAGIVPALRAARLEPVRALRTAN